MSRIRQATLALVLIAILVSPPMAMAQGQVRFERIAQSYRFPEEIVFSVEVSGDADIVGLELSFRATDSPYTQSRWPTFTPGRQVKTSYRLDTQVDFYPPGTEFRYYWTATDANGQVFESPEQTFLYDDNRFSWNTVSTEDVAVYWYEGSRSFGQEVLDTATRALARLEQDAGVETHRQVRIYLYANRTDFYGALGPNSPEWIGGQSHPAQALIVAWLEEDDSWEIGRMIPHELSHVVLYQATHNPYAGNPNWLEEGLAVHNQEVPDYEYPLLVEDAAREGQLIPLRALSASFPSDPDLAILSYAESYSIIEFILERYGPEGMAALVDVFAEGETAEEGVRRALGVSLDELEAQWRATLPAPAVTPAPGETPLAQPTRRPTRQRTALPTRPPVDRGGSSTPLIVGLLASGLLCMGLLAVGTIIVGVILLTRRGRTSSSTPQVVAEPRPSDDVVRRRAQDRGRPIVGPSSASREGPPAGPEPPAPPDLTNQ